MTASTVPVTNPERRRLTALKAAHLTYEAHTYKGTQHGFHNDTTPRFDSAAATLAWERTIALFNRTLRDAANGQAAQR